MIFLGLKTVIYLFLAAALAIVFITFFREIILLLGFGLITYFVAVILVTIFIVFIKLLILPFFIARKKDMKPKPGLYSLDMVKEPGRKKKEEK